MNGPARWGLGMMVSAAAHLGTAALVMAMLHRAPPPDQPAPRSALRIETEAIAQSTATPVPPQADPAATAPASGAQAAEGVVPSSVAVAAALPATPLAAAPSPAATLTAAAPAPVSKAATAPTSPLSPAAPPAVTQATPPPATALATTTTAAAVTPATQPPATPLAALAAATPALLATPPPQQIAPATAPTGTLITAALAWTGTDAQLDPASLTAIQSFMQPGDTTAQADPTHDALTAILSSVPCARLQAEFNPATGALDLRGHVPDAALKGPVLQALQAQLGGDIAVNDALLILPRPQCGALSGIAAAGLPQSQDQTTNPRLIGPDAQARAYRYGTGDSLILDLAAPDYDAYVYVDYFAADGSVIHLIPNATVPLRLTPAQTTLRVGAPDAGAPYLTITIGPPYGQEIAAAFAASAPLYTTPRPLTEPAAPYLDWLKTQISAARADTPGFKGEWVYFFVTTQKQ